MAHSNNGIMLSPINRVVHAIVQCVFCARYRYKKPQRTKSGFTRVRARQEIPKNLNRALGK
jgi:hypothetical protein